jgi:integrase
MRRGEVFALHWQDVDLEAASLRVRRSLARRTGDGFVFNEPKSKKSRRQIVLTKTAVDALRRHRRSQALERWAAGESWEDMDLVFANQVGRPIEPQNFVDRNFKPLLDAASLPRIRFHDLRHTAASLLLEQGVHPKIVSEMLGHSQIAITLDLYSHVTPTMQQGAADALDRLLRA